MLLGGVAVTLAGCSGSHSSSDSGAGRDVHDHSLVDGSDHHHAIPDHGGRAHAAGGVCLAPGPERALPLAKLTAVRRIEADGNGPDAALQVIDAQYGGLLTDSASVLVVTRSWRTTRARTSSPAATPSTYA